ncbi:uncharacterized protein QC763_206750 [Podospora pseudopauciseta]|uniref:Uncharacterized protein n=1 Tax=Podospora pseudopauciseta TaxID=2093780 RepID=A0ABR0HPT0_9PEZI|nr:hypothetical protein QC763_206750 [Podospora pseudopauciseta]
MCPVPYSPQSPFLERGRNSAPVNAAAYGDDESTVCSDDSSVVSSVYSDRYWISQEHCPLHQVEKNEAGKQVYEAWNITYLPGQREVLGGFKALGVGVHEYQQTEARVSTVAQASEQSVLAHMFYDAVKQYQDKHRRGWAGRILRGKQKTYEEHLDTICGSLPNEVQHAITDLLLDRGRATSTSYRTRTWTLVTLRVQSLLRFSGADHADVPQPRRRLWKKKAAIGNQALRISLVIRGGETGVSKTADGLEGCHKDSNPWGRADEAETSEMARERHRQRGLRVEASRPKRTESPPSYRSTSVSPHRERRSFASPPSYTSRPDRSRGRSLSSEQVRHRVQRRDRSEDSMSDSWPSPFGRDPYGAPTPPETYTPPPAISAYSRPSVIPPPLPTQFPLGPPMIPRYLPPPLPPPPMSMLPCKACQTLTPCMHFPNSHRYQCHRQLINTVNNIPTHPPCVFCFGGMSPSFPPPPPPPPMPSYYPGPMPMGPPPPPPPGMWPPLRPIVPPSELGEMCGTSALMATPPPRQRQDLMMRTSEFPRSDCRTEIARDAMSDFDFDSFLKDDFDPPSLPPLPSSSSSSSSLSSRSSSPVRRPYRPARVQDADEISVTSTEVSDEDARSARDGDDGQVPQLEEGKAVLKPEV